ncbi:hypothetical protein QFZ50_001533 [Arthrobacter agilis]|nr:hypothetical protein [Arthrobacter agilis]
MQPPEVKRFLHPTVGRLDLNCQTLLDPDQSHRLLVYTAVPGSDSHEKLQLLTVIGTDPHLLAGATPQPLSAEPWIDRS